MSHYPGGFVAHLAKLWQSEEHCFPRIFFSFYYNIEPVNTELLSFLCFLANDGKKISKQPEMFLFVRYFPVSLISNPFHIFCKCTSVFTNT